MNQEKIGAFIARRRKEKKLTQAKLASYLGITDRAVSKWERGKGLPDPVYMLELCRLLDISVNELLTGEFIEETKYQQKAEDNLLIMAKQEVKQTKKMFFYENVIGIGSTIIFTILIFMSVYFVESEGIKILLFIFAFLFLITGISIALKIETEEGYYECQKCHHKYIPSYRQVYFAMHIGRTRYMKCPHCQKRSWQKKIYSK
ncbi:helix-turn-helix domain-containing protein [Faecalibacillus faecis]|uniref:helix-turn-helix domain-containing protein n=1 Tax=Faecalibacillus faecis TaxID=1982628 RepID=UPI0022E195C6|nr:helix-turn-helix transcriptional regulator [Faecalibacillus faecis]